MPSERPPQPAETSFSNSLHFPCGLAGNESTVCQTMPAKMSSVRIATSGESGLAFSCASILDALPCFLIARVFGLDLTSLPFNVPSHLKTSSPCFVTSIAPAPQRADSCHHRLHVFATLETLYRTTKAHRVHICRTEQIEVKQTFSGECGDAYLASSHLQVLHGSSHVNLLAQQ